MVNYDSAGLNFPDEVTTVDPGLTTATDDDDDDDDESKWLIPLIAVIFVVVVAFTALVATFTAAFFKCRARGPCCYLLYTWLSCKDVFTRFIYSVSQKSFHL